ncbi:hypothetical protein KDW_53420 [Dictyobacter vulcani]|uniref:DUF2029 domain-containing protein n=1 Tax=Dictyobacter vulcani TaxID=2607529 RepID=A0A5J4KXA5_9CHLR|nr:glycosyltransferase 87 family protein [Dictyobacter vulcani]GER91180.1 hypothetical protein KDW_53420 [Dictyobacter vulcani]
MTIGSFLSLFDPAYAPYVWLCTKVYLSLALIIYFVWSFRSNKYIGFATFILLANFSSYLELAAWQFHSVLNMLLLLFLIASSKKHSAVLMGLWYGLSMLIKPIGLLFLPLLIFKGRWKAVGIGVGLFVLATLIFLYQGIGTYYTNNLQTNLSLSGTLGPNQIITLSAWLHYNTHWPDFVYQAIQYFALLCIVGWGLLSKVSIPKAAFLMVAYYLCFYEQVFEYQWSTLAYVLAICVLICPEFQTKRSLFCILLTCLPSCFLLLNLLHIDVTNMGDLGMIPGRRRGIGWSSAKWCHFSS